MLVRFRLYGFLKNQRPFEPFFALIFLERGWSFAEIGGLIAFRELLTNLAEVPSGALADLYGRRACLLLSVAAYIASFALFALDEALATCLIAAALLGFGDAFRSGTHKALIFAWLRREGREDERTAIYGLTRSYSKLGSAASVVGAAAWVLLFGLDARLFALAIPFYVLLLASLASYPASLEDIPEEPASVAGALRHLRDSAREAFGGRRLRRLFLEAGAFDGMFAASKDFLQPILKALAGAALLSRAAPELDEEGRMALLVGAVYGGLFVMASFASRGAARFERWSGGSEPAARRLWLALSGLFLAALTADLLSLGAALALVFVAYHVLQNLWRPLLIARIDAAASQVRKATLLSIESQARRLTTAVLAPILGACVDWAGSGAPGSLWPVALAGLALAALVITTNPGPSTTADPPRSI